VAYRDLVALDDHRHAPVSLAEFQHFVEQRLVDDDIVIADLIALFGEGLTGRGGVGSGALAEDADDLRHR
jgi:hypothetical protein